MTNTTRLGLTYPVSTAPADVPADMGVLANQLDTVILGWASGLLSARPAASANTVGTAYYATDVGRLYYGIPGPAWSDLLTPVGGMMPYPSATPPNSNWLLCNHQAVSRTTYAALFAEIGVEYGIGDGTTTFNVPPTNVLGILDPSVSLPPSWIAWPFASFTSNFSGYQPCQYWVDPMGFTHLRGLLAISGTPSVDQAMGTLPFGVRPALSEVFTVEGRFGGNNSASFFFQINGTTTGGTAGQCLVLDFEGAAVQGTNPYISLSGITFQADPSEFSPSLGITSVMIRAF